MVQWLRLHTPNARDIASIPGWGTKISHATQCSKKKKKKKTLKVKKRIRVVI